MNQSGIIMTTLLLLSPRLACGGQNQRSRTPVANADVGDAMQLCRGDAVAASALHVDGWRSCLHVPLRCRRAGCTYENKYLWYNFRSESTPQKEQNLWCWPQRHELLYFFCTHAWGVSTEWLRPYTQRLNRHFASFTEEAAVHQAAAVRKRCAAGLVQLARGGPNS